MNKRVMIYAAAAFFSFAGVALAVGGGGEGGGHEGSLFTEYLWKVLNFGILVAVLVKFMGKPMKAFLRQRTELIEKTLSEARQARELAEKALRDVQERLKNKDRELEELLAQARRSGEAEREALMEEAGRLAEKMVEQAKANIEFELKRAKASIKEEAVVLAIELAEKKIKEKLGPEEQRRLLEESVHKLEGKN